MIKSLYESEREFKFLDYNISHSQLLIRSIKSEKEDFNIDIIFNGIDLLFLKTRFYGLKINFLNREEKNKLIDENSMLTRTDLNAKDKFIVSLYSKAENFFIHCYSFNVYKNNLDILESSIPRYQEGDFEETIY